VLEHQTFLEGQAVGRASRHRWLLRDRRVFVAASVHGWHKKARSTGELGRTGNRMNFRLTAVKAQLPIELATFVNVVLAFVPTDLIAAKQTVIIKASMTAYSTAVGPSSDWNSRPTFGKNLRMGYLMLTGVSVSNRPHGNHTVRETPLWKQSLYIAGCGDIAAHAGKTVAWDQA
jgi:hypothetical protein